MTGLITYSGVFIRNAIEGQLISTGAFEVVFNGKIINSPGLEWCH